MAKAIHLSYSAKNVNTFQSPICPTKTRIYFPQITKIRASSKNNTNNGPLITERASRAPRRFITLPALSGRWHGKWTSEYIVSLRELQLDDLAEDGYKDSDVFISLSLQKHTGYGLSVDGRVITSIGRKCRSCCSCYCRKIDTNVCVWILPDGRNDPSEKMPELGGDDPSVIYVKPGYEADLDSLIQDTIRLQTSVKETCSESCEMSKPKLHYIGEKRTASLEMRWSMLLKLRNNPQ